MSMNHSTRMEAFRSNQASSLRQALALIERRSQEETTGYAYFDAAWRYRRMALCELLMEGRRDRYFAFLCKAALLQRHLLQLASRRSGIDPIHLCASMTQAPVNALAAGCLDVAEATARAMPAQPLEGMEYEDDFLFYDFLRTLVLRLTPGPVLSRWLAVLAGGEDPYFDVCRALADGDSAGFTRAFEALLEHRVAQCEHVRRTQGADGEQYLSEAFVFMKGLALLRLAELLGMETRTEYPLIPRFARLPMNGTPLSASSWRVPEQEVPR